jgi:acyl-coenzyme A synthetase/AMP-(fatty) acid ligase
MPVARVVLRDDTAVLEVLEWCRTRLAPYMVPRRFDVCDELPLSAAGKRLRATGTGQAR